jgi:predicted PolB exonuclease-like 3'-5' exonuclease
MNNVYIDIETIPAQPEEATKAEIAKTIKHPATMSKPETISDWHNGLGKYSGAKDALIDETYLKTSFSGSSGEIISIAYAVGDNPVQSFSRALDEPEDILLRAAFLGLSEFSDKGISPYFVGHYISGFDLKFLFQRAVILGVNPGFKLNQHGRHGSDFYDTMSAWEGYRDTISLDNLAKALGIEGKDDIDGSMVWGMVKEGRIADVETYNRSDVEIVRKVYKRLNFVC